MLQSRTDKTTVQAQLEGEPFHKAPRVPPAETPGIRRSQAEALADPCSPTAHPHQMDMFVDSFIDNLISDVKAELTAAAATQQVTGSTAPDLSASDASDALQSEPPHQTDTGAPDESADLQPAAQSMHDGSSPEKSANAMLGQQASSAGPSAAEAHADDTIRATVPAATAAEMQVVVQELMHDMLNMVTADVSDSKVTACFTTQACSNLICHSYVP